MKAHWPFREKKKTIQMPTCVVQWLSLYVVAISFFTVTCVDLVLKVKCNEIWTIFLLLKILFKNISHTNRKQNQLSKLSFAQTVVLKIRKSDGFRELHENEPEMAAPRLETNIRYLWRNNWRACFYDHKRTGKRGHIVADTLLTTQMFPRLPARATLAADTNFVSGTQKCFRVCSETFAVGNKCFSVCARKETSWATMFPQQCVLVCHRLKRFGGFRGIIEFASRFSEVYWLAERKLKHYVSKATLISVYYSLIYPYLIYACTLWGNNYNAPLSQIVKLQNKVIRVINDVPLMESITPHYTSLGLLKFPDIVKLNTCMLFYDYFHHEKFPNIPVSLVSELHNYSTRSASSNQVAIPSFRTNLRRFCPSIIGSFFWNDIPQFIRDKPSKKMFRKALSRWYLAQY